MMPWLTAVIYDRFMQSAEEAGLRAWRRELLADLRGSVLEIGAGTGANLPFFPEAVTRVVVAEPDAHMRARLEKRLRGEGVGAGEGQGERNGDRERRVTVSDADVEHLAFDDSSFDAVVTTLVLCSVEDPVRALAQIRRVLVPGGALVYLEHVAAEHDARRLAWQRRIEPFWTHVAGNCHLTRRTSELIRAGFVVERETRESARKTLPIVRTMVRGIARRPV